VPRAFRNGAYWRPSQPLNLWNPSPEGRPGLTSPRPTSSPAPAPVRSPQSYKDDNLWRETSAEKRELDRLQWDMVNEVRQAAEVRG
jgi:hypothetical protein